MHERESKIIYKFLKYALSMKAQNKEDIFTLDKINPPFFYFIQENNIVYKYNASILFDFIEKTGCYKDPQSQIEYNAIEIKRLEKLAKRTMKPRSAGNSQVVVEEEASTIVPFLENELGESIRVLIDNNTSSDIQLNDKEEWYNILQSLNELKVIGLSYYESVINQIISNLKHEEKRIFKKINLYFIMINSNNMYDYFLDDRGNITICEDESRVALKYYTTMYKYIMCKTLLKEFSKQHYYQCRFQTILRQFFNLPTIEENDFII